MAIDRGQVAYGARRFASSAPCRLLLVTALLFISMGKSVGRTSTLRYGT